MGSLDVVYSGVRIIKVVQVNVSFLHFIDSKSDPDC